MPIRKLGVLLLLGACACLESGCIYKFVLTGHEVVFNGTLVDAQTGQPVPGVEVAVWSGDRLVYAGDSDGDGVVRFTHTFKCCHRELFPVGKRIPSEALTVVFSVEAGDYGVLEIPVRLGHGSDAGTLGELRLVPKEGP